MSTGYEGGSLSVSDELCLLAAKEDTVRTWLEGKRMSRTEGTIAVEDLAEAKKRAWRALTKFDTQRARFRRKMN